MKTKLYSLWLDIVEKYWDYMDETTTTDRSRNEMYTFRNKKRFRNRREVRREVTDLAHNFRTRNRNWLWEYFYNTAISFKRKGKQEVLKNSIMSLNRWVQLKREPGANWADMTPASWYINWCPKELFKYVKDIDFPYQDNFNVPELKLRS